MVPLAYNDATNDEFSFDAAVGDNPTERQRKVKRMLMIDQMVLCRPNTLPDDCLGYIKRVRAHDACISRRDDKHGKRHKIQKMAAMQ